MENARHHLQLIWYDTREQSSASNATTPNKTVQHEQKFEAPNLF